MKCVLFCFGFSNSYINLIWIFKFIWIWLSINSTWFLIGSIQHTSSDDLAKFSVQLLVTIRSPSQQVSSSCPNHISSHKHIQWRRHPLLLCVKWRQVTPSSIPLTANNTKSKQMGNALQVLQDSTDDSDNDESDDMETDDEWEKAKRWWTQETNGNDFLEQFWRWIALALMILLHCS